ncbi:FAD/NAD(P)-binding domain-containing protein [Rhizopogon salebrosus TDB-379]|nr:FAD/NAD(P)-binding domain-containing protein [Rhizopogon salebrosus TDB-379]
MSLPESTAVLIVGAGPAGLTAALSLIHHGCRDFIIVDAALEGRNTSRAIVIHAATIEALNSISAADDLLSRAVKGKSFRVASRTGSSQIIEAKYDTLKKHTAYPYAFVSPQNVTELVLVQRLQRLGVQVQRPHKVVGMKQNEKDPRMTNVSFEDGQVVKTRYIVGADGARSIVRLSGISGFVDCLTIICRSVASPA